MIPVAETTTADHVDQSNPQEVSIEVPDSEKESDGEYPKVIGRWWTTENFVRLNCWISFWISAYIFLDAVRVSGIRLYPDLSNKSVHEQFPQNYNVTEPEAIGNPTFPMLIGVIFFKAMVVNGFILVTDSNLNFEESLESVKTSRKKTLRKMFKSVMALSIWTLTEIFLTIVALIYFDFLYGPLSATHYLIC